MTYSTSGASEMIFMKRRSRSSRATGPNTRVPIGSLFLFTSTAAVRSHPAEMAPTPPRPEHARPDRLVVVVDEHRCVAIEADVAAVAPPLLLASPHDHRLHDLTLLHRAVRRRFLDRRGDDVAEPRVAACRSAAPIDYRDSPGRGIVGAVQNRSHLNHCCALTRVARTSGTPEPSRTNRTIRTIRTIRT